MTVRFENRTLESALEQLTQMTGISVVLRPGVEAPNRITTTLNNVAVDTAVRMFAHMNGLDVVAMDTLCTFQTEALPSISRISRKAHPQK